MNSLGSFDQCLAIKSVEKSKYCLAHLDISKHSRALADFTNKSESLYSSIPPTFALLGLCIPWSCSSEDLSLILHRIIEHFKLNDSISVNRVHCTAQDPSSRSGDFGGLLQGIVVLSLSLLLCSSIFATLIDSTKRRQNPSKFVYVFSLYRNLTRLNSRQKCVLTGRKSFTLAILDGIRAISSIYLIIVHSYNFGSDWLSFENPSECLDKHKSILYQPISNGFLIVNNFIVIGGFLSYPSIHQASRLAYSNPAHIIMRCFSRYLRLAPMLVSVILITQSLMPKQTLGPNWERSTIMFEAWCLKSNWLPSLFLLQNFISPPEICFGHSWYLAVDFQLYISVFLLSYFSVRLKLSLIRVLLVLMFLTQFMVAALVYIRRIPSIPLVPTSSIEAYLDFNVLLHIKPYYWLSSYYLGFILSHNINSANKKRVLFEPHNIQLMSLTLFTGLMFSSSSYFQRGMTRLESTLFALLAGPLWSACIAAIIYSLFIAKRKTNLLCKTIKSLLSSSFWVPISNLSLLANLLNPPLIAMFYGSRTETFQFNHWLMLYFGLGNLVVTFAAAFVLHLLLELPIRLFIKQFTSKARHK